MPNRRAPWSTLYFLSQAQSLCKNSHNHPRKCTFYFVAFSSRYCFGFLMRNKLAFMIQILKPLGHCVINRLIDFAFHNPGSAKTIMPSSLWNLYCKGHFNSICFSFILLNFGSLEVKSQQKCCSYSQRPLQVYAKQLISFRCFNMAIVRLICPLSCTRKKF